MHAGEIDQAKIDAFTEGHREDIAMQETMVLLTIDGSNIHFGENQTMADTVHIFPLSYRTNNLILSWTWIMKSLM